MSKSEKFDLLLHDVTLDLQSVFLTLEHILNDVDDIKSIKETVSLILKKRQAIESNLTELSKLVYSEVREND